ncbi:MAG: 2OG-Fe(II) oxygenase family protein [Pseudomonadota bacterium]
MGTTTGSNHFPTTIFQQEVPDFAHENEKLYRLAKRLQAEDPGGIRRSNLEGWHSSDAFDIRDLPELAEVQKVIIETAALITEGMGFNGLGTALSAAWFTVSPAGASNLRHCHPRSFLSGAYYIKVPPGSSPICFHDPRPVKLHATPASGAFQVTPYTTEAINCQVRESLLVIFPGWLDHSVPPHRAEGERVVLSFNFVAL